MRIIPAPKNSIYEILKLEKQLKKSKSNQKSKILLKCVENVLYLDKPINSKKFTSHIDLYNVIEKYLNRENTKPELENIYREFYTDFNSIGSYYRSYDISTYNVFNALRYFYLYIIEDDTYYIKSCIKSCIEANECYFNCKLKKSWFAKLKIEYD